MDNESLRLSNRISKKQKSHTSIFNSKNHDAHWLNAYMDVRKSASRMVIMRWNSGEAYQL